jgi:hypothetical protein
VLPCTGIRLETMKMRIACGIAVLAVWAQQGPGVAAGQSADVPPRIPVQVKKPARFGIAPRIDPRSATSRYIPAYGASGEVELYLPPGFRTSEVVETERDPLARGPNRAVTPQVELSFPGYDSDDNEELLGVRWRPSDANGDVGADYYVQWSNKGFKTFRKSDGALVAGPIAGNAIWAGFGGPCESANGGDPIVLYDHLAHRWLFSQFTASIYPDGHQCLAITQGTDPLGPYFLYDYLFDSQLNDYPKLGLWADAASGQSEAWGGQSGYFLSTNRYSRSLGLTTFVSAGVLAFDRDAMLMGDPQAAALDFGDLPCDQDCYFSLQPAHLEGEALPPGGSCSLFVQAFDDEVWGTGQKPDGYQFWEVCVDWDTPVRSRLTLGPRIAAPEFDSELCAGESCVPQPSTDTRLATLSQYTMNRFVVRYLGSSPLPAGLRGVLSHTVDLGGNRAGVRWARFTLPDLEGIAVEDTGTFAPDDGLHRWMPAIGLDALGSLAVVYSRSGASSFPSVFTAGRYIGDPSGTLRQEVPCIEGTGVQATADGRWGDYASVSLDPSDQCTFWMTHQYVESTGDFDWDTRICTFQFEGCSSFLFGDFWESGDLSAWTGTQQ